MVVPVPRAKEPEVRKENRTGNHLDSLAHHKVIGEARRCGHYQTQLSALPGKVCDLLARSDFLLEQIDVNVPVRTRIYAGAVMERSKALEFVNIILVEPFSASVSRTRLLVSCVALPDVESAWARSSTIVANSSAAGCPGKVRIFPGEHTQVEWHGPRGIASDALCGRMDRPPYSRIAELGLPCVGQVEDISRKPTAARLFFHLAVLVRSLHQARPEQELGFPSRPFSTIGPGP